MLFTDLSSERLVRALKKAGFNVVSEGKHIGMSNGQNHVTIPRHKRINPYTVSGIIKDAKISLERFKELP